MISTASAEPEKPTATFSADVTEGYAPLAVHFTSETTGDPTSYFWTFEPQTSSDWNSHHAVSAGHTFRNPGVYDISLVITNSAGSDTVTEHHYITVLAPPTNTPTHPTDIPTPTSTQKPTASFTADVTSGKIPLVVTFTDTSTGGVPTSRYWNFGDGTNSASGPTVTHTFTNPGTYTVALTVTNDAGSDTKCKNNYVTVAEALTCQPVPSTTSQPVPSTTSQPESSTTSQPEPSTTSQHGPSLKNQPVQSPTDQPAVNLHSTKTTVSVGEEMQNTLSVVNLIDKPIMHAQVILVPHSGTSVTSSQFVQSGGGQYTAAYDINPGMGKNIDVNIVANQVGNFNVIGRVHYYFGDDKTDAEDYPLDLLIQASDPQPTPTPIPRPIPDLGAASLVFIIMTVLILKRNIK